MDLEGCVAVGQEDKTSLARERRETKAGVGGQAVQAEVRASTMASATETQQAEGATGPSAGEGDAVGGPTHELSQVVKGPRQAEGTPGLCT